MSPSSPDRILLAEIGAAHGVRGEVRVKAHTGDPRAIADYGPLSDEQGRRYVVATLRPLKDDMLVVRFEGIPDRTVAERLNRTKLYVARDALPATDDEDEFYHADLVGLDVVTVDGAPVGSVIAVANFGADDLLEVARPGRRSVYVPFTKAVVPTVDLAARRILVDPPAGLLDDADTPPGDADALADEAAGEADAADRSDPS